MVSADDYEIQRESFGGWPTSSVPFCILSVGVGGPPALLFFWALIGNIE